MFNSIQGEITGKGPEYLWLQSGDVEWDLAVSATTLQALPPLGSRVRVWTWLQHTEDTMKFFAFSHPQERSLFLDLIKVNGVGPKAAMKFLSGLPWKDLEAALEAGDTAKLSKIPGMGLKTAQKVVLALKGRLQMAEEGNSGPALFAELVQSLADMGFDRKAVEKAVASASGEIVEGDEAKREKLLFQRALQKLSGAE